MDRTPDQGECLESGNARSTTSTWVRIMREFESIPRWVSGGVYDHVSFRFSGGLFNRLAIFNGWQGSLNLSLKVCWSASIVVIVPSIKPALPQ